MKIQYIILVLFVIFSCDNKSSDDSNSEKLSGTIKVLLASNSASDMNSVSSLWADVMPNFEFHKVRYDTIKSKDIEGFDVIILWENGNNQNSTRAGDTIAEYVLNGGNVILGTFYGQGRTNSRYTNTNYGALEQIDPVMGHVDAYANDTLVIESNEHELLDGVTELTSDYGAGDTLLINNAKLIKKWKNGDIFAAYNEPKGRILYMSLWPAEFGSPISNNLGFFRVWANAIRFAYAKGVNDDDFFFQVEGPKKVRERISIDENVLKDNPNTGSR